MEPRDWISIGALIVSLMALMISLRNRHRDLAHAKANQIRTRVWETLSGEPGYRTIIALSATDGKTDTRRTLLERTAKELKVAGASELGEKLEELLKLPWPKPSSDSLPAFEKAVGDFMKPT